MKEKYAPKKMLKFRSLLYTLRYFPSLVSISGEVFTLMQRRPGVWVIIVSNFVDIGRLGRVPAQVASQCRSPRCKWLVSTEFRCKKLQSQKDELVLIRGVVLEAENGACLMGDAHVD